MAARTSNFTGGEKSLLADLVKKYSSVVENKRTDTCTTKVSHVTCIALSINFSFDVHLRKRSTTLWQSCTYSNIQHWQGRQQHSPVCLLLHWAAETTCCLLLRCYSARRHVPYQQITHALHTAAVADSKSHGQPVAHAVVAREDAA